MHNTGKKIISFNFVSTSSNYNSAPSLLPQFKFRNWTGNLKSFIIQFWMTQSLKTEHRARRIHGSLQQKGVTQADVKTTIAHSTLSREESEAEEDEGKRGGRQTCITEACSTKSLLTNTHNRIRRGLSNLQQRPRYNPSSHSEVQRFMLIIITLPWLFNLLV